MSDNIPPPAKQLFALGPKTEAAVVELFRTGQGSLFPNASDPPFIPEDEFKLLAGALFDQGWSDDQAEQLIQLLTVQKRTGKTVDIPLISRWVLAHPDDAESVALCIEVEPPNEIEIRKVLSRAGSQKVVFLGTWRLTQREVVVKRLLHTDGTANRELESFPLTVSHYSIIETHRLQNAHGELFLVEEKLDVLDDDFELRDIQEAANLLYDVCSAIKYLHDHDRVHGDIKPDNIGRRHGNYVLLDFGICRPIAEFTGETTATGSLRTRAPELLLTDHYIDPVKVDVWALGATIFAGYNRRFPLLNRREIVPRVSHPIERRRFEEVMAQRVRDEWETRMDCQRIPSELREIVESMLLKDPQERISSGELLNRIERTLPAFLRASDKAQHAGRFSPLEELQQIEDYLEDLPDGTLLPSHKRSRLRDRLHELEVTQGFTEAARQKAQQLAFSLA